MAMKYGWQIIPALEKVPVNEQKKKCMSRLSCCKKWPPQNMISDSIIIYGKSLGTGIAAYVASESKYKRLILETPYYSIPAMFATYASIYPVSYMSLYKIPTWKFLQDVKLPSLFFMVPMTG